MFIAHDLSVVKHIANRVAVMYLGKIVEIGETIQVFDNPMHPYTEALLSAIPIPDADQNRDRKRIVLKGDVPIPTNSNTGCNFYTRCPYKMQICKENDPSLSDMGKNHLVSCFLRT